MIAPLRSMIREHFASVLVTALSSLFGVLLIAASNVLSTFMSSQPSADSSQVRIFILTVGFVFFMVAVYVGSVVTTNSFATVIAGQTRLIALYRLIGSSAIAQRRTVTRRGLLVGFIGSVLGAVSGACLAVVGVWIIELVGVLPALGYAPISALMVAPAIIVVLSSGVASRLASRRVLRVTPLQATGTAVARPYGAVVRPIRIIVSSMLITVGALLLGQGVSISGTNIFGIVLTVFGALLSFTGLLIAAPLFVPWLLWVTGRVINPTVVGRVAAAETVRNPERSSRTAIALVIGVTLISSFVVGSATAIQGVSSLLVSRHVDPHRFDGIFNVTTGVFVGLVAFSMILAAVGVVNDMSANLFQRTREIGLLRALGFTTTQVKQMVFTESAQLLITSVTVGLALGTTYGWLGAQSLISTVAKHPLQFVPILPWGFVAVLIPSMGALIVIAAIVPARRAIRVSPVVALRTEDPSIS